METAVEQEMKEMNRIDKWFEKRAVQWLEEQPSWMRIRYDVDAKYLQLQLRRETRSLMVTKAASIYLIAMGVFIAANPSGIFGKIFGVFFAALGILYFCWVELDSWISIVVHRNLLAELQQESEKRA